MDALIVHITENKFVYSMLLVVLGAAALWSLSRYFATKKELFEHKELLEQHWEANNIKMENHRIHRAQTKSFCTARHGGRYQ